MVLLPNGQMIALFVDEADLQECPEAPRNLSSPPTVTPNARLRLGLHNYSNILLRL